MRNLTQALGSVEIAGRTYTGSQVQIALYIMVGLIALILLGLIIRAMRNKGTPPVPRYEEIFDIES